MRLRAPDHWRRRNGPSRGALLTLIARLVAPLWATVTAARIARATPQDCGRVVICVGAVTVGGSGKTPIVRELVSRLRSKGLDAHVLTRGYGGRLAGPVRVDPAIHSAAQVGDEALMLAKDAPVWVARQRPAGARAAISLGAEVIVMDDGHQNPTLRKTLSLVVVDGETRHGDWPFGDGRVIPAGPMREPLAAGLARADAVVIVLPADLAEVDPDLMSLFGGKPVLIARLEPSSPPPAGPQVGFAGIGKPEKFERALIAAGCDLRDFAPLADHQPFSDSLLTFLERRAGVLGAGLVTTEKDWVRLPPAWRERIAVWPARARFDDSAALDALLATTLRLP